jgi:hypothetical protein
MYKLDITRTNRVSIIPIVRAITRKGITSAVGAIIRETKMRININFNPLTFRYLLKLYEATVPTAMQISVVVVAISTLFRIYLAKFDPRDELNTEK